MLSRRGFIGTALALSAVGLPRGGGALTPEMFGGDLRAALAVMPDHSAIAGGQWWADGPVILDGVDKQLLGLTVDLRAADTRFSFGKDARHCAVVDCSFLRPVVPATATDDDDAPV